jgi:hypothetical protein
MQWPRSGRPPPPLVLDVKLLTCFPLPPKPRPPAKGDNPENDAARIAQLLKQGAHALGDEGAGGGGGGGGGAGADGGFASEGIEQILEGRSEKRQLGTRKGNTFSTATFGAAAANDDADYERAEEVGGRA